jgi:hypothetical protein
VRAAAAAAVVVASKYICKQQLRCHRLYICVPSTPIWTAINAANVELPRPHQSVPRHQKNAFVIQVPICPSRIVYFVMMINTSTTPPSMKSIGPV